MRRHHVLPGLVAAAMVLAAPSAMAQSAVETFYTGKQLQLVIGAEAGGVTSLHDLGILISMPELDSALKTAFAEVFGE